MPRKTKPTQPAEATSVAESPTHSSAHSADLTPDSVATREADLCPEPLGPTEKSKNWGPPYKAIYTNAEKGFELGEDRRFKQRVFKFKEKPDEQTRQMLKDAGFRYRPDDQSWTVQADAASRELSDRIAQTLAGREETRSR